MWHVSIKMKKRFVVLLFFATVISIASCKCRSIYRPSDPLLPSIIAKWQDDDKIYKLSKYHLEEYPLFCLFDKEYFEKNILPTGQINFRYNPNQAVNTQQLTDLIIDLLNEIKKGKRNFTHFSILQSKDYNFNKSSGLLIVKFKKYPFVVKLFVETPESFVSPFDKGIEPIFCFFMSGGINRHLLGFTRLKNREIIMQRIAKSPWARNVDIPRKWHWVPPDSRWIEMHGFNIGQVKEHVIQFPGTYCIIADAIEHDHMASLFNSNDKKMALDLCNYLDVWIDPHMKNFMIEKESKKFIIVDTEHFPSFTGLKEKVTFESYTNWYLYLTGKCWRNTFMQTKKERHNPKKPHPEMSLITYDAKNI